MRTLAREAHAGQIWQVLGWAGTLAGFLILSYYSVIGGWTLGYVFYAVSGTFSGLSGEEASALFGTFVGSPLVQVGWHTVFMLMTMWVISRGVRRGLEKAVTTLMPALVVLLLIMVGYAMTTGFFLQGVAFLFTPDFSHFSGTSMLTAMGHAFFTLSLGMGAIMMLRGLRSRHDVHRDDVPGHCRRRYRGGAPGGIGDLPHRVCSRAGTRGRPESHF